MRLPKIVVCAAAPQVVNVVVENLRDVGDVVVGAPPDLPLAGKVGAYVIINCGEQDRLLLSRLQSLGEEIPLVVIGSEPVGLMGVTCWLPSLPDPVVLRTLVTSLVSAGPATSWKNGPKSEEPEPRRSSPPSWRRKTDLILGDSRATRLLLHELDRLASSAQLALITGESGTGKELVARALHSCGPRASEPFVALNCAALPEQLVEAELFGYQRGAFTGAVTSRGGAFEAAQKGTLFLDEIGEISKAVQAKLLRVLETNVTTRLGSTEARPFLGRVVAATNRDLEMEVSEGRYREDLYYRLHVFPVQIAPLRERPEDIPPIAAHHISLIAEREKRRTPRLTPGALERLLAHSWPGNVRELVHVLSRAVLVAPGTTIEPEHIVLRGSREQGAISRYRDAKQRFERDYYAQLMKAAGGNVTLAARLADKTRKEVYDAMKRLQVEAVDYRAASAGDSD